MRASSTASYDGLLDRVELLDGPIQVRREHRVQRAVLADHVFDEPVEVRPVHLVHAFTVTKLGADLGAFAAAQLPLIDRLDRTASSSAAA